MQVAAAIQQLNFVINSLNESCSDMSCLEAQTLHEQRSIRLEDRLCA